MMTEAFVRWLYFYGIILLKHDSMNYVSMNYISIKWRASLCINHLLAEKKSYLL